ncbi:hypothetical protein JYU34_013257 [Plutella xylostella]|uniref:Uncharacterized protein n=1 Tax=Plutella xylostella TaxID=51655 RepID=A0ABQ7Q9E9_PLUXY|nr:hypothetical protein JYU34_013257 [Plutella xylostella]
MFREGNLFKNKIEPKFDEKEAQVAITATTRVLSSSLEDYCENILGCRGKTV